MKDSKPCIAIDTMGGDYGPITVIPGVLQAARQREMILKLVGRERAIKKELAKYNTSGLYLDIINANEVAEMGDKPSHILRRRRDTSIQVCYELVKESEADGVLSAGHTGVALACGIFTLGRIKGIERPGLAAFLPREKKPVIVIDVGANVDSKPRHLVQFAIMADVLARNVVKLSEPKIGLLSIGEEQGKGNFQVNEAYELLKNASLNFEGNVEGRDLLSTDIDVVVCDGFVGNVALKLSEGLGNSFAGMLRKELGKGFFTRLGAALAMPAFKRFMRKMDYEEYGGAPLLGLNGTIFVCHGGAGPKAIEKALNMTSTFIETEANEDIKKGLEANPEITRFQKFKKMLHTASHIHSGQEEDDEQQDH